MTVISWQIPRNALGWLLVAQLLVLGPHISRLPPWLSVSFALVTVWRIMIYQGRWPLPPPSIKTLLALGSLVAVYLSYGTLIGLEPTVAIVIIGFYLKLIEINRRRDAYIIIFLGFFVTLTGFLFAQEFTAALYALLPLLLLTTALTALHQHALMTFSVASLKKAAVMLLQSVPMMLLLFVVFPRLGPLWSVPASLNQAKSGVADQMSPGDMSQLARDSALAFRVRFDQAVPDTRTLYWRAVVMTDFDGRRWSVAPSHSQPIGRQRRSELASAVNADAISYTVFQEPTFQSWLFGLPVAVTDQSWILMTDDYRLRTMDVISEQISYSLKSNRNAPLLDELTERRRNIYLRLPEGGNPRSRALAQQLLGQSSDTEDFVSRVLSYFREQPFIYTLSPPQLGEDSIDEFLFSTRRGFCGHYASSFTFLMRAAGIPARIVAGYQGGEVNPLTGTVLVHQFDAHAWSEVWTEQGSWQRVDPTAAVAPERIEQGVEQALASEQSFLADSPMSALRYRHIKWLNRLRLQLDALNYYWASWVLQYRGDRQLELLQRLLGAVTPGRMALLVVGVGASVLALIMLTLGLSSWQRRDPVQACYLKMCRHLASLGYVRQQGEGAIDYAKRLSALKPQWRAHLMSATRAYVCLSYERISEQQRSAELRILQRECRWLRMKAR